jgi:hypothetical protein
MRRSTIIIKVFVQPTFQKIAGFLKGGVKSEAQLIHPLSDVVRNFRF